MASIPKKTSVENIGSDGEKKTKNSGSKIKSQALHRIFGKKKEKNGASAGSSRRKAAPPRRAEKIQSLTTQGRQKAAPPTPTSARKLSLTRGWAKGRSGEKKGRGSSKSRGKKEENWEAEEILYRLADTPVSSSCGDPKRNSKVDNLSPKRGFVGDSPFESFDPLSKPSEQPTIEWVQNQFIKIDEKFAQIQTQLDNIVATMIICTNLGVETINGQAP